MRAWTNHFFLGLAIRRTFSCTMHESLTTRVARRVERRGIVFPSHVEERGVQVISCPARLEYGSVFHRRYVTHPATLRA